MGANPFVVSTLSINSCLISTDGLCLRFNTVKWSVEEGGFGHLGDFAVILLTEILYSGDLAVEFLFAVGDTGLVFLLLTLIHAGSYCFPIYTRSGFFCPCAAR